jgi:hypothetical protein
MMSRPLLGVENVRGFRYESSGLLPVGHITRATGKAPTRGTASIGTSWMFHLLSGAHTFSKKFALFYSK